MAEGIGDQEAPETTEVWTYTGERINAKGELSKVWIKEDGSDMWYSKVRAAWIIGGRYTVTLTREGLLYTKGPKSPSYIGPSNHDLVNMWRASDRQASTVLEHNRLAKKGDNIDNMTIAQVREWYQKQGTHAKRCAALAMVIEAISKW